MLRGGACCCCFIYDLIPPRHMLAALACCMLGVPEDPRSTLSYLGVVKARETRSCDHLF